MYTLKLGNGKVIGELSLNGGVFITPEELTREDFAGGLGRVEIAGTGEPDAVWQTGEYERMKLTYFRAGKEHREFCLETMSEEELSRLKNRADLEYVAMMSGVEL